MSIFSVPSEIRDFSLFISTWSLIISGVGVDTNEIWPFFISRVTIFILQILNKYRSILENDGLNIGVQDFNINNKRLIIQATIIENDRDFYQKVLKKLKNPCSKN